MHCYRSQSYRTSDEPPAEHFFESASPRYGILIPDKARNPILQEIFEPGEPVYTQNYMSRPLLVPASVLGTTGPVSYESQTRDRKTLHRHIDQMQCQVSDNVNSTAPEGVAVLMELVLMSPSATI